MRFFVFISVRGTCISFPYLLSISHEEGARGGAVGLGTALKAGRSWARFPMVPFHFFIGIILPAELWP